MHGQAQWHFVYIAVLQLRFTCICRNYGCPRFLCRNSHIGAAAGYWNLFQNLILINQLTCLVVCKAQIQQLLCFSITSKHLHAASLFIISRFRTQHNRNKLHIIHFCASCNIGCTIGSCTGTATFDALIVVDHNNVFVHQIILRNQHTGFIFVGSRYNIFFCKENLAKLFILNCFCEYSGCISCRCILFLVVQAVYIGKICIITAQLFCITVHFCHKSFLIAHNVVSKHHRSIISRRNHHAMQQILYCQDFICRQFGLNTNCVRIQSCKHLFLYCHRIV